MSAFATRRRRCGSAVTMAAARLGRAFAVDWILQSGSAKLPALSANGLPMSFCLGFFRGNLFSQRVDRKAAVRFGTAALSGLSPFATVSDHVRAGFLRGVNAAAS